MESNYKVWYFPGNGRAANIRAILSYVDANWEDKRIWGEEFANLQKSGNLDYLSLPALQVDNDKWLSQTVAIEIWLAKRFNLLVASDSDDDEYEILNLLSTRDDLGNVTAPLYHPSNEQKAKREEIIANLKDNEFPFYLKAWEKKFLDKRGKYFLGDRFTLADILLSNLFETLFSLKTGRELGFDALCAQHAPQLTAHLQSIKNNELARYFKDYFSYESNF